MPSKAIAAVSSLSFQEVSFHLRDTESGFCRIAPNRFCVEGRHGCGWTSELTADGQLDNGGVVRYGWAKQAQP